jgi:hypothetical protein
MPKQDKSPSLMSLAVTAVVALVLFAGVVVVAKRLPIGGPYETTGAAPVSTEPNPQPSKHPEPARSSGLH